MAYNHRKAEIEWLNWKEKEEKQLRGMGVDEDTIQRLHTYDWQQFKAERNFYEWQSDMSDTLEWAPQPDIVQKQLQLLKMHNDCPAFDFDAELEIQARQDHLLSITWRKGGACARLEADLSTYAFAADTDVDGRHFHFAQEG